VFSWRDMVILLTGWAIVFFVGLVLDASSLVLHLVTYLVIALAVSAHYIWEDIANTGRFEFGGPKRRARAAEERRARES
jgi:hypothetical protein